jgi:hypothetical protein
MNTQQIEEITKELLDLRVSELKDEKLMEKLGSLKDIITDILKMSGSFYLRKSK